MQEGNTVAKGDTHEAGSFANVDIINGGSNNEVQMNKVGSKDNLERYELLRNVQ